MNEAKRKQEEVAVATAEKVARLVRVAKATAADRLAAEDDNENKRQQQQLKKLDLYVPRKKKKPLD